jgi:hypothetical protein
MMDLSEYGIDPCQVQSIKETISVLMLQKQLKENKEYDDLYDIVQNIEYPGNKLISPPEYFQPEKGVLIPLNDCAMKQQIKKYPPFCSIIHHKGDPNMPDGEYVQLMRECFLCFN